MILLGLTCIGIGVSLWLWVEVKKDQYADLTYTSSVIDKYYELTFYQRELSLKSVGERILDIRSPDSIKQRREFAVNILKNYGDLLAFGLADTNGQLLVFTGAQPNEKLPNLTDSEDSRRSFLETQSAKGLVIGEVYFFDNLNDWILPIRVPIRDQIDSLIAINTSGIPYKVILDNLRSFGFNQAYRIHMVNATYQTTQVYFPLDSTDYKQVLGKNAEIYENIEILEERNGATLFKGFNAFENKEVIGIKTFPGLLNHYLIVSVDPVVLWQNFWPGFKIILSIYVILILLSYVTNRFIRHRDQLHNEELKAERDYFTNIINMAPVIIIGVDDQGLCNFCNPATEQLLGYTKEEITGQSPWAILLSKENSEHLLDFTSSNGEIRKQVLPAITKKGETRIVSWNSLNLTKGGEIIYFGNDITDLKRVQEELDQYSKNLETIVKERTIQLEKTNNELVAGNEVLRKQREELESTLQDLRQAQEQLIQAEKMASLGVLSAGIGHEINNPLNFIKGGIEGLERIHRSDEEVESKEYDQYFSAVNEGVKRASAIVKSLSHFSRQGETLSEMCNLHEIMDNCLVILENKTKHKIKIEKNYHHDQILIVGNEGKLHQVFLNILANAEQAIEEEGEINLNTSLNKRHTEIRIRDSGHGISKENLPKVVDPFFTTKAPGVGTGLGMYISHNIIIEHGGSMKVSSQEGIGTELIIKLPLPN